MNASATASRRPSRAPFPLPLVRTMTATSPGALPRARLLLALLLALGLIGCGKDEEAAPATAETAQPAATAPAEAVPPTETVVVETPEELAKRARAALDAQNLFTPPGDNAFELYLRVIEVEPDQPLARNALTDLFPYAVMHVEQRLGANDADDAERVLALMEKANPQAPALPRLKEAVSSARERQVAAEAAEAERAARAERAAQEAAEAATRPAAAPAPAATPPPAAPSTPPPAAEPQPAPAPATPPPAAETAPPPPRRPAGALPPVASQVSPRYPPLALRRRVEGYVELQFTVLPDGSVTDVSIVRSEPRSMFDRAAIDAMQRWRFQPTPGGEPVRGRRLFDFKLPD
jgi:protein TonB